MIECFEMIPALILDFLNEILSIFFLVVVLINFRRRCCCRWLNNLDICESHAPSHEEGADNFGKRGEDEGEITGEGDHIIDSFCDFRGYFALLLPACEDYIFNQRTTFR